MEWSFPAFHAITASTANSGSVCTSARTASASPCETRNSAAAARLPLEHVLHDVSVRPGRLSALSSARPRLVSRAVLERLADSKTPQHLLAVARRRDVAAAEILAREGPVVFLFGVQDPGNL